MNLIKILIMISIIPLLSSCSVFGINSEKEATYTIIFKNDNFEIREYNNLVLATTKIESKEKARNSNFRKLFNYISGDNDSSKKISMTTPVIMEENDSTQIMSFVLPKEYSLKNAPEPKNSNIKIENYINKKFVIYKWKGGYNQNELSEYKTKLKTFANTKNYGSSPKCVGNFRLRQSSHLMI